MKPGKLSFAFVSPLVLAACGFPEEKPVIDETAEVSPLKQVEVTPIDAADTIDAGLSVGSKIPEGAVLATSEGEQRIADLLKDGPAVLVFTRSVEWCPFCQTQLKAINGIVPDIKERGFDIYGISYDNPGAQDRFAMNQMLEYQMLSDESSKVIDAFDVRDPQYTEGRAVGVPYAAIFIVNQDGTIRGKSVSRDFKKRPTNEQLLMLLDEV
jgi:peroxiredoxin